MNLAQGSLEEFRYYLIPAQDLDTEMPPISPETHPQALYSLSTLSR
jgi:hypothetical protein